jgi:hypothetical protein
LSYYEPGHMVDGNPRKRGREPARQRHRGLANEVDDVNQ